MAEDIVPALMRTIMREFNLKTGDSAIIKKALLAAKNNQATYADANAFAVEVGQVLASTLGNNLSSAVLPDGKMYFNIGSRVLNETLKNNYDLVTGFTNDVQAQLNARANIGLKVQTPKFNQDKVDGIVNRLSSEPSFDDVAWLMREPVVNFTQSIVDDSVKANADFQAKAGLHPTITRRLVGRGCDWCRNLAGTYEYKDAPDDIYHRHENDRCTVEYDPGSGKRQDVWSKKWKDSARDDKLSLRKQTGITRSGPGSVLKMNLQFFGEKDLASQTATSLKKGIRHLQAEISFHELKISHPEQYIDGWETWSAIKQEGMIKHWKKEQTNFLESVNNRITELNKRGEHYEE